MFNITYTGLRPKQAKVIRHNPMVSRQYLCFCRPSRALDSFQALLDEKSHCLAHPDALISAVGTKVYEFVSGQWREDVAWAALLGEGWDLAVAREAAYSTLAQVGIRFAETCFTL